NVVVFSPFPRPPWPPWHKKISAMPDPTPPKLGGSPQSQSLRHPSRSNQSTLAAKSETFNIGVILCAFIILWVYFTPKKCACPTFHVRLVSVPSQAGLKAVFERLGNTCANANQHFQIPY